jgi:uncharacterized protein (DUF1684 family)
MQWNSASKYHKTSNAFLYKVSRADSRWFFFFVDSETTNCRDVYDHRHVEVEERKGDGDTRVFFLFSSFFFFFFFSRLAFFSF